MSHSLHCAFFAAYQVNDVLTPTVNILPNSKFLSGIVAAKVYFFIKYTAIVQTDVFFATS